MTDTHAPVDGRGCECTRCSADTAYAQRTGCNPFAKGGPSHLPTLQAKVLELEEQVRSLKAATSAAAQTTVTALDRIIEKENILLKEKLDTLARHYDTVLHESKGFEETIRTLRASASAAAASTVAALDRIIEMEKVVKAAESWAVGGSHAKLTDAVTYWQKIKGWS